MIPLGNPGNSRVTKTDILTKELFMTKIFFIVNLLTPSFTFGYTRITLIITGIVMLIIKPPEWLVATDVFLVNLFRAGFLCLGYLTITNLANLESANLTNLESWVRLLSLYCITVGYTIHLPVEDMLPPAGTEPAPFRDLASKEARLHVHATIPRKTWGLSDTKWLLQSNVRYFSFFKCFIGLRFHLLDLSLGSSQCPVHLNCKTTCICEFSIRQNGAYKKLTFDLIPRFFLAYQEW